MAGCAAFGKMPSLGDFFRLNAAPDFVTSWDVWAQRMLTAARQTLGGAWNAAYLSAPIWRFALAPAVAGAQGAVGVLMPSVDRVGRQFPLTLYAPTGSGEQVPLRSLMGQGALLSALEDLALDCLDDAMTREVLQARLDALSAGPMAGPSLIGSFGSALVLSNSGAATLCADLALDLAGGDLHRSCAWSASVDGGARLILTAGLLEPAVAHFLFDLGDNPGTGAAA